MKKQTVDQAWVRELVLYADGSAKIYDKRKAYQINAMRRIVKGTYDGDKADKLWFYYADQIRHAFQAEFGGLCPKFDAVEVGKHYARDFEDLVRRGYVTPEDLGVKGTVPDTF